MKLINKEQVSHIVAFDFKEGVWCSWGYWAKLLYIPYKKHKWWRFDNDTEEGYYEDGKKGSFDMFRSIERVKKNSKEWVVIDNSVWTKPFIQIFSGKSVIHEEYFENYLELENHLSKNYPNVNIKYE